MPLRLPFSIDFDMRLEDLTDALTDADGKVLATTDKWEFEDLSEIASRINDRDRLAAELAASQAECERLREERDDVREAAADILAGLEMGEVRVIVNGRFVTGICDLRNAVALAPPAGEGVAE